MRILALLLLTLTPAGATSFQGRPINLYKPTRLPSPVISTVIAPRIGLPAPTPALPLPLPATLVPQVRSFGPAAADQAPATNIAPAPAPALPAAAPARPAAPRRIGGMDDLFDGRVARPGRNVSLPERDLEDEIGY